jgi:hypothetical protein
LGVGEVDLPRFFRVLGLLKALVIKIKGVGGIAQGIS